MCCYECVDCGFYDYFDEKPSKCPVCGGELLECREFEEV